MQLQSLVRSLQLSSCRLTARHKALEGRTPATKMQHWCLGMCAALGLYNHIPTCPTSSRVYDWRSWRLHFFVFPIFSAQLQALAVANSATPASTVVAQPINSQVLSSPLAKDTSSTDANPSAQPQPKVSFTFLSTEIVFNFMCCSPKIREGCIGSTQCVFYLYRPVDPEWSRAIHFTNSNVVTLLVCFCEVVCHNLRHRALCTLVIAMVNFPSTFSELPVNGYNQALVLLPFDGFACVLVQVMRVCNYGNTVFENKPSHLSPLSCSCPRVVMWTLRIDGSPWVRN